MHANHIAAWISAGSITLALIASSPVSAEPAAPRFEIAGYRLGMTNAQASKIGLNVCTDKNIRAVPHGDQLITCFGVTPDFPNMPHPRHNVAPQFNGPYLSFESKTKRLMRIEFLAFNWGDPDPRTQKLLKLLNVDTCAVEWRFDGRNDEWKCAVQPDRVLSVSITGAKTILRKSYPSHLDVIATIDKSEVSALYAARAHNASAAKAKARKESELRKVEAGK